MSWLMPYPESMGALLLSAFVVITVTIGASLYRRRRRQHIERHWREVRGEK